MDLRCLFIEKVPGAQFNLCIEALGVQEFVSTFLALQDAQKFLVFQRRHQERGRVDGLAVEEGLQQDRRERLPLRAFGEYTLDVLQGIHSSLKKPAALFLLMRR